MFDSMCIVQTKFLFYLVVISAVGCLVLYSAVGIDVFIIIYLFI